MESVVIPVIVTLRSTFKSKLTSKLSSTCTVPAVEFKIKLPLLVLISFDKLTPILTSSICASLNDLLDEPIYALIFSFGSNPVLKVTIPDKIDDPSTISLSSTSKVSLTLTVPAVESKTKLPLLVSI